MSQGQSRWFQFSLGRMLLVVTILCIGPGGYVAYEQQEAQRQDAAVASLNKLRGTQAYIRAHWLRKWIDGPEAGYVVGLAILSPQATDSELAPMAALSELVWIDIDGTEAGDASLAYLAGLKKLQRMRIEDTNVTDAGMVYLAGLSELHTLNLSRTKITDVGMAHLAGLTKMATLDLSRTGITDESIAVLSGMKNLEMLDVRKTQITTEGVIKLQKALPNCMIAG
ncbi:MAG: leucine-rich repeat domain-containing protein [Pirellulaceae bacterium]